MSKKDPYSFPLKGEIFTTKYIKLKRKNKNKKLQHLDFFNDTF